MTIRLNRLRMYFASVAIVVMFVAVNRINKIYHSELSTGVVVAIHSKGEWQGKRAPEISYNEQGISKIFIASTENLNHFVGEELPIIYTKNEENTEQIFTFLEFWLSAIVWAIAPIMILTAAIFSYFTPKASFVLDTKTPFRFKKKTIGNLPNDSDKISPSTLIE